MNRTRTNSRTIAIISTTIACWLARSWTTLIIIIVVILVILIRWLNHSYRVIFWKARLSIILLSSCNLLNRFLIKTFNNSSPKLRARSIRCNYKSSMIRSNRWATLATLTRKMKSLTKNRMIVSILVHQVFRFSIVEYLCYLILLLWILVCF